MRVVVDFMSRVWFIFIVQKTKSFIVLAEFLMEIQTIASEFRRLHFSSVWSFEKVIAVFTKSPRTGGSARV
jgi:hypothetical protein